MRAYWLVALLLTAPVLRAEQTKYPKAKVSFDDFKSITAEVEPHRAKRLVDFDTFLKMAQEPGTIVLDSRSAFRYDRVHLKGAKHLAFTDFTQNNLAKAIPRKDARILIYCNNNFDGDQIDFATKAIVPVSSLANTENARPSVQMRVQEKPRMLALNVPTYINLYGYGYRNVYELDELVRVDDPRVKFEGSTIKK